MDANARAQLIAELELKKDHDVLILAAADISELKTDFKQVCVDVQDHSRRLTILETNWKAFVAIVGALVVIVPLILEIILR